METNLSSSTSSNGADKLSNAAKSVYDDARSTAQNSSAALRSQLSSLKTDLDALVNRATNLSDNELSEAYDRLMTQFSSLRHAAKGIAGQASKQINRGVETTTDYVKDRPMQSVAVATGLGVLLGMLFKRR